MSHRRDKPKKHRFIDAGSEDILNVTVAGQRSSSNKRSRNLGNHFDSNKVTTRSMSCNNNATVLSTGSIGFLGAKKRKILNKTLSSKRSQCANLKIDKCKSYIEGNDSDSEEEEGAVIDCDNVQVSVDAAQQDEDFPEQDVDSDEQSGLLNYGMGNCNIHDSYEETVTTPVWSEDETEVTFKANELSIVDGDVNAPEIGQADQFKKYQGDPAFEKFIKSMVAKEMEQERSKWRKEQGESRKDVAVTSKTTAGKDKNGKSRDMVKSPSDTTIYAPALNKSNRIDRTDEVINSILLRGQDVNATPKSNNEMFRPRV